MPTLLGQVLIGSFPNKSGSVNLPPAFAYICTAKSGEGSADVSILCALLCLNSGKLHYTGPRPKPAS